MEFIIFILPVIILSVSLAEAALTIVAVSNIYSNTPIKGDEVPYGHDSLSCLQGTEYPQQRSSLTRGVGSPNDFE